MIQLLYIVQVQGLTFQALAYTLDWKLEEREDCEAVRRKSILLNSLLFPLLLVLPLLLLYVMGEPAKQNTIQDYPRPKREGGMGAPQ